MPLECVAELTGAADEYAAACLRDPVSLVAPVHKGVGREFARQPFHLVQLAIQRVPIVGIAGASLDAHNEAFPMGHGQAHLDAKFVGLVGLPLRDAFHLRRRETVDLAFGGALLREDQLREEHRPLVDLEGRIGQLALSTYRTRCVLLLVALADAEPPSRTTRPVMVFRLFRIFLARLNCLAFAYPPCFWKARAISFR